MATADQYTVQLRDGRMLNIYFRGAEEDANSRFSDMFGSYDGHHLQARNKTVPENNNKVLSLGSTGNLRVSSGDGNWVSLTDSQKSRLLTDPDYIVSDIYAENNFIEDVDQVGSLSGSDSDFDPFSLDDYLEGDDAKEEDLLATLLGNRSERLNFFDRTSVDPLMRRGGTQALRNALERAFDPVDASFQLQGLLAPRGFEYEGMGGGGADVLPRFADWKGNVPTIDAIRGQLTELIRRRDLGEEAGGLSESAEILLGDQDRQRHLIEAATNTRSTPGFMRNAIQNAIRKKIQLRQFEAPGADILNQFVDSGFRL